MEKPRLPIVIFEERVHAIRPYGRPRKRWQDIVGRDLLCLLKKPDDKTSCRMLIHERVKKNTPTCPLKVWSSIET